MGAAADIIRIDGARARMICEKIRDNMTSARDLLIELYEGRGWEALGYATWRECVAKEFGQHQSWLYRQLEAAQVEKELAADPVFAHERKNNDGPMPTRPLVALAKAPDGARAEVYKVATDAGEGKPTEQTIKAAVKAKKAKPEAPAEELVADVKTIVNGEAKVDKAVEKARASGRIPAGVVVEVEDPGDEATDVEDVRMEREEQAAKVDDLTDDEWLATFPLMSKLSGLSLDRFKTDALHYRRMESTRRKVRLALNESTRELYPRSQWRGGVHYAWSMPLTMSSPDRWIRCADADQGGCAGAGNTPILGDRCSLCFGKGYRIQ